MGKIEELGAGFYAKEEVNELLLGPKGFITAVGAYRGFHEDILPTGPDDFPYVFINPLVRLYRCDKSVCKSYKRIIINVNGKLLAGVAYNNLLIVSGVVDNVSVGTKGFIANIDVDGGKLRWARGVEGRIKIAGIYGKYVVAYDDARLLYVDAKDGEVVKVVRPLGVNVIEDATVVGDKIVITGIAKREKYHHYLAWIDEGGAQALLHYGGPPRHFAGRSAVLPFAQGILWIHGCRTGTCLSYFEDTLFKRETSTSPRESEPAARKWTYAILDDVYPCAATSYRDSAVVVLGREGGDDVIATVTPSNLLPVARGYLKCGQEPLLLLDESIVTTSRLLQELGPPKEIKVAEPFIGLFGFDIAVREEDVKQFNVSMSLRVDAVEDELVVLKRVRLRAIDAFGRPVEHSRLGRSSCSDVCIKEGVKIGVPWPRESEGGSEWEIMPSVGHIFDVYVPEGVCINVGAGASRHTACAGEEKDVVIGAGLYITVSAPPNVAARVELASGLVLEWGREGSFSIRAAVDSGRHKIRASFSLGKWSLYMSKEVQLRDGEIEALRFVAPVGKLRVEAVDEHGVPVYVERVELVGTPTAEAHLEAPLALSFDGLPPDFITLPAGMYVVAVQSEGKRAYAQVELQPGDVKNVFVTFPEATHIYHRR